MSRRSLDRYLQWHGEVLILLLEEYLDETALVMDFNALDIFKLIDRAMR